MVILLFSMVKVVFCTLLIAYGWSITVDDNDCPSVSSTSLNQDTVLIQNKVIGIGSRIMTDQDALVVLPPTNSSLTEVSLYFSSVQTASGDSSRIFVKSLPSWSCGQNGGAHPFQSDQYTLGISKNIAVKAGWNIYEFAEPIVFTSDSIFIWPDLTQQINPRIVFAGGFSHPSILRMNGVFCGNTAGQGTHPSDFACSLTFVKMDPCLSYLKVMDSDSTCYAADTMISCALIGVNQSVNYLSKEEVILDSLFEVKASATLSIDMAGCP